MRVAFVGAGPITVGAAEILIRRRVDVVIIEKDKECIEALADTLDCGFIHGDGSSRRCCGRLVLAHRCAVLHDRQ